MLNEELESLNIWKRFIVKMNKDSDLIVPVISVIVALTVVVLLTQNIPMVNATNTTGLNLGAPFYNAHGKITSQKALKTSNGISGIEVTYNANGTAKGVNITDTGSFSVMLRGNRVQYGQGQGALVTKDGDSAPFNFQFIGNTDAKGKAVDHGSWYTISRATGKLGFLNNEALLFKAEIEKNGTFSLLGWEWNK